jgi:hypothetical protein
MADLELFQSYLDESENAPGTVYAVGGFVGKAVVWDKLKSEWAKWIPPQVTAFHATDCFTGNNEFEGIDIPHRVAILDKVTDVIAAHEVWLVGYGIDTKIYASLAPNKKQNEFLANKYAAPFGGAVELACKAMGNVPGPDEVWKVQEEGETWGRCDFLVESNEYSPSGNGRSSRRGFFLSAYGCVGGAGAVQDCTRLSGRPSHSLATLPDGRQRRWRGIG